MIIAVSPGQAQLHRTKHASVQKRLRSSCFVCEKNLLWRGGGSIVLDRVADVQVEDPWTSEFLKYKELGFSHGEVGMALGALGPDADQDSQVRHMTQSPPDAMTPPQKVLRIVRCASWQAVHVRDPQQVSSSV